MSELKLIGGALIEWMTDAPIGSKVLSTRTKSGWVKISTLYWEYIGAGVTVTPALWEGTIASWICIPNYTVEEELE